MAHLKVDNPDRHVGYLVAEERLREASSQGGPGQADRKGDPSWSGRDKVINVKDGWLGLLFRFQKASCLERLSQKQTEELTPNPTKFSAAQVTQSPKTQPNKGF